MSKKTSRVFVAGGQPTFTYVDRKELRLTDTLEEYIESGYSLVSLTGATKSGKTVLCRSVLSPEAAMWLGGGEVSTETEFWERIIAEYGGYETREETATKSKTETDGTKYTGTAGLPFAKLGLEGNQQDVKGVSVAHRRQQKLSVKALALSLITEHQKPIVIDDFHYVPNEVQKSIVRGLKQKIFDGLQVVVLAVPHSAYDSVRVETEMTGRVKHVQIPRWENEDLRLIPGRGFPELNVHCSDEIINSFLDNCFSSPHLMQWFCNKICLRNGVKEEQSTTLELVLDDVAGFFSEVAASTSKPAFDRLATGPRQRTDRIPRKFQDGTEGDIYIAVLRSIAASGPRLTLTYEDIRARMREILSDDVPQAQEISRVLSKMTEIAREKIDGEPVLEWEEDEKLLHIIDPFFAFYLKWGVLQRPGV